jgi:hypothetical protein
MSPSVNRASHAGLLVAKNPGTTSSSCSNTAFKNEIVAKATVTGPISIIGSPADGGGEDDGTMDTNIHWTVADRRFQEILQFYAEDAQRPYQQQACDVVKQLSPQEQEDAALCSYSYWHLSCKVRRHRDKSRSSSKKKADILTNNQNDNTKLPEEWRFGAAVREAIRHLEGVPSVEKAVELLKSTLQFHRTNQTWQYRCCIRMIDGLAFDDMMMTMMKSTDDDPPSNTIVTSTGDQMEKRKSRICHEMANLQTFVTRGHDRDLRSVIFAYPRKAAGEEEHFIDSILYTVERAVACTEFQSRGRQDKIVAVMDSQGSTAPPMKACKVAVNILQQYYPGRLKNLIILNPPYMLLGIYKMIKPFMDPDTAAKFIVVKGTRQTEIEIAKLIDPSQAMPIMIPTGQLESTVDVSEFLYHCPFFCLYDDDGKQYRRTDSAPTLATHQSNISDSSTLSIGGNKNSAVTATSTTRTTNMSIRNECSNLISVRSLAVGELVMTNHTGNDDEDDLYPRVLMVQA